MLTIPKKKMGYKVYLDGDLLKDVTYVPYIKEKKGKREFHNYDDVNLSKRIAMDEVWVHTYRKWGTIVHERCRKSIFLYLFTSNIVTILIYTEPVYGLANRSSK